MEHRQNMNSNAKVFALVGMVVAALLAMHFLPALSFEGTELRPVNLLSDVLPEVEDEAVVADVVPEPPKPAKKHFVPYHPKGVVLIEDFAEGKAGGMDHIYEKLLHADHQSSIHIAYFGDSFIEGDIMTCDLREDLQAKYGGQGPGWVDCGGSLSGYRPTVKTNYSGIQEFVVTKKPFNSSLQAISQRYYVASAGAQLKLTGTNYKAHLGEWGRATLFFRSPATQTVSVVKNGGEAESMERGGSAEVQTIVASGKLKSVQFRFPSANSRMQLMGVALDGDYGVSLDNFSMRGSAGFTIAEIPATTLREIGKYRPYDLIIVQYGLNAIGGNGSVAQCEAYTKRLKKAVEHLRAAYPESSILIASVSDRVQRSSGGLQPMKGLQRLAVAQRKMAAELGVGFISMVDVMGGPGSMKEFVEKGWAAKDYTHMSFKGGKVVADRFFQSILAGVENYRRANATE